jgi:hypothetical protein
VNPSLKWWELPAQKGNTACFVRWQFENSMQVAPHSVRTKKQESHNTTNFTIPKNNEAE